MMVNHGSVRYLNPALNLVNVDGFEQLPSIGRWDAWTRFAATGRVGSGTLRLRTKRNPDDYSRVTVKMTATADAGDSAAISANNVTVLDGAAVVHHSAEVTSAAGQPVTSAQIDPRPMARAVIIHVLGL